MTTPRVSVCMITYNHERYIAQAVESVLMQKTRFPVELVVGDDCSTDRTPEILADLERRYPGRIRLHLRQENLGAHRNNLATLGACRSKYIAVLDGDDYWTSSDKLQMQVDFLEEQRDCAICAHQAEVVRESQGGAISAMSTIPSKPWPEVSSIETLLREPGLPNCSVMYRRMPELRVPVWFEEVVGDWILHLLHASHGKVGFLPQVMAVYRVHPQSDWAGRSLSERLQGEVGMCGLVNNMFDGKHEAILSRRVMDLYRKYGWWAIREADYSKASQWALEALRRKPLYLRNWRLLACAWLRRGPKGATAAVGM